MNISHECLHLFFQIFNSLLELTDSNLKMSLASTLPVTESLDYKPRDGSKNTKYIIPEYTIDLSLNPCERYTELAKDFESELRPLSQVFDELLLSFFPSWLLGVIHVLARLCLQRVFDSEETQELLGISRLTGVALYQLVAFNVVLDCLLGCTSGGVRVWNKAKRNQQRTSRMVHFRSLDWGMDPLRKITCQLNFVAHSGGPVIARSVTYFGFVGVLTGVRPGLSLSLNFRPHHDSATWKKQSSYYFHCLLVLLGRRRSISSVLRRLLIHPKSRSHEHKIPTYIKHTPSTAAYLIFCTGQETVSIDKDNYSARSKAGLDFIVTTNHEDEDEVDPENLKRASEGLATADPTGMSELVEMSLERKSCAIDLWERALQKERKKFKNHEITTVRTADVVKWMEGSQICNEETHYAVIMDPTAGDVIWSRVYKSPEDFW